LSAHLRLLRRNRHRSQAVRQDGAADGGSAAPFIRHQNERLTDRPTVRGRLVIWM